jgi:hypothetical protein
MPTAGPKPATPAIERPQIHALDSATTGMGSSEGDNPIEISKSRVEYPEEFVFRCARNITKNDYYNRRVCPHGTTRLPLDGLLMKFHI